MVPHDHRRDLWQSYLEIVRLARPRAVIMENVPDMALDREMFIAACTAEKVPQLMTWLDWKLMGEGNDEPEPVISL